MPFFCNLVYDKILYRYKNKAVLQKEEQLYTYLIYLRALFYRNLINTILMTATVKFGREELCQNHVRFFSADEASRHHEHIGIVVLTA